MVICENGASPVYLKGANKLFNNESNDRNLKETSGAGCGVEKIDLKEYGLRFKNAPDSSSMSLEDSLALILDTVNQYRKNCRE